MPPTTLAVSLLPLQTSLAKRDFRSTRVVRLLDLKQVKITRSPSQCPILLRPSMLAGREEIGIAFGIISLFGFLSNFFKRVGCFRGRSLGQLQAGSSKHNQNPSLAADVAPWPLDWKDKERFYHFAGRVSGIAQMLGIAIRWGGDWNGNNDLKDQTFYDLPHFELAQE